MKSKFCFSLMLLTGVVGASKANEKPNILIIFTDDQGYNDLACYGSKTNKTPVMDKFVRESTSFTNFYVQPTSGASRSALLTGRYPCRSGGTNMPGSEFTMAEMLKESGYQTACVGKWDLSGRKPITNQMPNAQGFDYYYGPLGANDGHSIMLYENNKKISKSRHRDMSSLIRMYTDKTIELLENRDKNKPMFMYLAHTMMHVAIDASPEFKGKSARGLYGDVVEEFDYHTGRLLDKLKELDMYNNTIIIYTTDNGPWCQQKYIDRRYKTYKAEQDMIFWGDVGELRAGKGSAYEGGSRSRCAIKWSGKVAKGKKYDGLMASIDFMPTFANIVGYKLPQEIKYDGVDQTKFITGKSKKSARENFCYMQHNIVKRFVAVRDERWKLLMPDRAIQTVYLMDFGTNSYELYDLKNDISETNDVSAKYPEIVERLKKTLEMNM